MSGRAEEEPTHDLAGWSKDKKGPVNAVHGYSYRRALFLIRQDGDGLSGVYVKDAVVMAASEEEATVAVEAALSSGWWLDIRGYKRTAPQRDVVFDRNRLSVDRIGLAGEILPGIITIAFLSRDDK